jgi:Leucine-rich repeat (LRR) protein
MKRASLGIGLGIGDYIDSGNSGCTDPTADNYDATATVDDGSCYSCASFILSTQTMDATPGNSNGAALAIVTGGTAPYTYLWFNATTGLPIGQTTNPAIGLAAGTYTCTVTDANGCTGSAGASVSTGYTYGCIDPLASNYIFTANTDDGSCLYDGCTNPTACNYNAAANNDDGSCLGLLGCTDASASNYNANATCDDGSCTYSVTITEGCTDPCYANYDPSPLIISNNSLCSGTAYCTIPDPAFRAALDVALGPQTWVNGNQIALCTINSIITLNVVGGNIASMQGIECFTALTTLQCDNNQLTSLDVSQNTALTYLYCGNNQLTSLNVSQNTALIYLDCQYNQLTSLNVSQNTALTGLNCYNNQLTSLDVSQNLALIILNCSINQLTSLNVSQNTALIGLECPNNQLTFLDITQNIALTYFRCNDNQLTSLNVSQNTALTYLDCQYNQITSLDVSQNTALIYLYCTNNQLTTLDVSANTALKDVRCQDNQLTSLDVRNGNNTNFTGFNASNNPNLYCIDVDNDVYSTANWTNIDAWSSFSNDCSIVYGCTDDCYVEYDPLATVDDGSCSTAIYCTIPDLAFRTALINHSPTLNITTNDFVGANGDQIELCKVNNIISVNVANDGITDMTGIECFTALTTLNCYNNQLTNLNVSQNTALTQLICGYNQLTSLNVSQNTALTFLHCSNNQLTSLNVSGASALISLSCDYNQLTSLDVSQNAALNGLGCYSNQITSLDLSQNPALTTLNCSYNQLTSLDVSQNPVFYWLSCGSNQLTSLDVRNGNNTNFTYFHAQQNPDLYCIAVDNAIWSNDPLNWTGWTFVFDSQSYFSNNCVSGCMDSTTPAVNYNPLAVWDNGSCCYATQNPICSGCTDSLAVNYDSYALSDDGSCCYIGGCTDSSANNYNPAACFNDGSCAYAVLGCMDSSVSNYNPAATIDDGSCCIDGCTDPIATNYNALATCDNGSCTYIVSTIWTKFDIL